MWGIINIYLYKVRQYFNASLYASNAPRKSIELKQLLPFDLFRSPFSNAMFEELCVKNQIGQADFRPFDFIFLSFRGGREPGAWREWPF